MPRRRIYKRDNLGRFSETSGSGAKGRAPAIKRREGKNAKRREASARLLKASLARQRHEDFYEKNKHKELTPQRNKQLSNAEEGLKREEAKIGAAKIAIATERGRALKADRLPKVKPLTPVRREKSTPLMPKVRSEREAARRERLRERSASQRNLASEALKASGRASAGGDKLGAAAQSEFGRRTLRNADKLDKMANVRPSGKRENLTRKIVANQKANEKLNSSDERQRNIDENQRLRARALAKGGTTITVGQLKVGDQLVEPRGAKITEVEDAGLAGVRYSHSKGGGGLSSPDQKIRVIPATRGTLPPLSKKERTSTIPFAKLSDSELTRAIDDTKRALGSPARGNDLSAGADKAYRENLADLQKELRGRKLKAVQDEILRRKRPRKR